MYRKPNKAFLKRKRSNSHKEEVLCDAEKLKKKRKTNPFYFFNFFFYDTCNTQPSKRNKGIQISRLWLK